MKGAPHKPLIPQAWDARSGALMKPRAKGVLRSIGRKISAASRTGNFEATITPSAALMENEAKSILGHLQASGYRAFEDYPSPFDERGGSRKRMKRTFRIHWASREA